jgi:hypothetical protein
VYKNPEENIYKKIKNIKIHVRNVTCSGIKNMHTNIKNLLSEASRKMPTMRNNAFSVVL